VDIPYPVNIGVKVDVAVTGTGFRSVTGVMHPTDANSATLSMLESIPGIGKKRAMSIIRNRPFRDPSDLWRLIDEPNALSMVQFHLTVENVDKAQ